MAPCTLLVYYIRRNAGALMNDARSRVESLRTASRRRCCLSTTLYRPKPALGDRRVEWCPRAQSRHPLNGLETGERMSVYLCSPYIHAARSGTGGSVAGPKRRPRATGELAERRDVITQLVHTSSRTNTYKYQICAVVPSGAQSADTKVSGNERRQCEVHVRAFVL